MEEQLDPAEHHVETQDRADDMTLVSYVWVWAAFTTKKKSKLQKQLCKVVFVVPGLFDTLVIQSMQCTQLIIILQFKQSHK